MGGRQRLRGINICRDDGSKGVALMPLMFSADELGFCMFEGCDYPGKTIEILLRFLPQLLPFLVNWAKVLTYLKTPKRQQHEGTYEGIASCQMSETFRHYIK